jgi:hypothetical protein
MLVFERVYARPRFAGMMGCAQWYHEILNTQCTLAGAPISLFSGLSVPKQQVCCKQLAAIAVTS